MKKEERNKKIIEEIMQGESCNKTARKYNISSERVSFLFQRELNMTITEYRKKVKNELKINE